MYSSIEEEDPTPPPHLQREQAMKLLHSQGNNASKLKHSQGKPDSTLPHVQHKAGVVETDTPVQVREVIRSLSQATKPVVLSQGTRSWKQASTSLGITPGIGSWVQTRKTDANSPGAAAWVQVPKIERLGSGSGPLEIESPLPQPSKLSFVTITPPALPPPPPAIRATSSQVPSVPTRELLNRSRHASTSGSQLPKVSQLVAQISKPVHQALQLRSPYEGDSDSNGSSCCTEVTPATCVTDMPSSMPDRDPKVSDYTELMDTMSSMSEMSTHR